MCIKRKIASVVVACAVGSVVAGTQFVRADDMGMKNDSMMGKDKMMDMGEMKKMMMDPAMAPSSEDMAKAKAMEEMVKTMSDDPACKEMCMKMSMKDDMKPSDDDVKKAKEAMMKDPAAMKMVMAHAMTMSAMHGMSDGMSTHGNPAPMKQ